MSLLSSLFDLFLPASDDSTSVTTSSPNLIFDKFEAHEVSTPCTMLQDYSQTYSFNGHTGIDSHDFGSTDLFSSSCSTSLFD